MTPDRLPPQNLDAERGVLGSMLIDNSVIDDLAGVLRPEHFYRDSHQRLARAIFGIRGHGSAVDSIILEDSLRLAGELEKVGGLDAILDVLGSVPHSANANYYARIVREKAVARDHVEAANETLRDAYSNNFNADELQSNAEKRVFAIGESESGYREPSTASEATAESLDLLLRRKAGDVIPGLQTGLLDIDALLGGADGGQLIIAAARPSAGKTTFGMQWATHISEHHRKTSLFISLEMGHRELADRMLSARAGVDGNKFKFPRSLKGWEIDALQKAQREIDALPPILIDDTASVSASQVAAAARRAKARHGIAALFIDYLQLIQPEDRRRREDEQIAANSIRLKVLARELDIPVIAMAQLNRESDRQERRPRMAEIRGSGQIEQDAHAIILLHRPELLDPDDRPGIVEAIIAKNRNGQIGSAPLALLKHLTRFENAARPDQAGAADAGPIF